MGKRLFEQGGDVTPSLDMRLASGKVGTPTVNHTWQTVVSWLEAVLNFLKKSENLNDLPNKTTARTNLGVYSTAQVDTLLGDKADSDNVLALDNVSPYVPTEPYHPATLQKVNESGALATFNFSIFGSHITSASIYCRQRGNIVTIMGYFQPDGTNGSEASPVSIATVYDPQPIKTPTGGIHYFSAAGNEGNALRCQAVYVAGSFELRYTSDSATNIYYFSFTYCV